MFIFSETRHCVTSDVSSDWLNKQNNSQPLYEHSIHKKFEESHSPSAPSRSSSFKLKLIRRLFSLAVSRSLLRRSSLVRRLFSLTLSRSLSSCSEVKLHLLSLFLSCSLSRCSPGQFRLLSLAPCRSLSRWAWLDGQQSLTSVERPSYLPSDFVNAWRHARLEVFICDSSVLRSSISDLFDFWWEILSHFSDHSSIDSNQFKQEDATGSV